jgi:hypothetical protein
MFLSIHVDNNNQMKLINHEEKVFGNYWQKFGKQKLILLINGFALLL